MVTAEASLSLSSHSRKDPALPFASKAHSLGKARGSIAMMDDHQQILEHLHPVCNQLFQPVGAGR